MAFCRAVSLSIGKHDRWCLLWKEPHGPHLNRSRLVVGVQTSRDASRETAHPWDLQFGISKQTHPWDLLFGRARRARDRTCAYSRGGRVIQKLRFRSSSSSSRDASPLSKRVVVASSTSHRAARRSPRSGTRNLKTLRLGEASSQNAAGSSSVDTGACNPTTVALYYDGGVREWVRLVSGQRGYDGECSQEPQETCSSRLNCPKSEQDT